MKKGLIKVLAVTFYASFLAVLIACNSLNVDSSIYASDISISQFEALDRVNELRAEKSLEPLKWNSDLANAAKDKAEDIVADDYFDHISPDGKKAWDFILAEGYEYKSAGENLAIDFSNIEEATEAWKKSPSHYSNIVSPKYNEFGFTEIVGNVDGEKTTIYVQFFGSKANLYERAIIGSSEGGRNVNI